MVLSSSKATSSCRWATGWLHRGASVGRGLLAGVRETLSETTQVLSIPWGEGEKGSGVSFQRHPQAQQQRRKFKRCCRSRPRARPQQERRGLTRPGKQLCPLLPFSASYAEATGNQQNTGMQKGQLSLVRCSYSGWQSNYRLTAVQKFGVACRFAVSSF